MDFGVLSSSSDPETKQRFLYGHHSNKQDGDADDWSRSLKLAKNDDFSVSTTSVSNINNKSIYQQHQQHQMLSFAPPKSEPLYYHRNTGYNCGNWNAGALYGSVIGVRGPFTPSQWMELEHQALIYKYINSNVPIPSNLLIPIRKAVESALFSTFSRLPFRPNTLGWGSFHLGYANSKDPEPGRCRRTDGKKWRCSKDAVLDQKYCERHINRGCHRSRKLVEAQSGASGASANSNKLVMPTLSPSLGGNCGTSHSHAMAQHQQLEHLQPSATDASAANRMFMNKDSLNPDTLDIPGLPILSSTTDLNSKDALFSIPKQQISYEKPTVPEFGHVSSDCLLNPANESFTFMNCRSYGSTSSDIVVQETDLQHPLRHFMDEWPKSQKSSSAVSWADSSSQSNRTELSISIPIDNSDDADEKEAALSPLRLSKERDPFEIGLGMGGVSNEQNGVNSQANWSAISWESSVGGPLGEVLHNTSSNSNKADYKSLNLLTNGWDTNLNSPQLISSPTEVLQKMAFGSVSNSSAGSSPRAEQDPLSLALPCNH